MPVSRLADDKTIIWDLAKLREVLHGADPREYPFTLELPSLVVVLLSATLVPDERRFPAFTVLATDRVDILPGFARLAGSDPISADALAKQAHATASGTSTLCVTRNQSGYWQVTGILPTPALPRHEQRVIPIEVQSPAQLLVRLGGLVVEFSRGSVHTRELHGGFGHDLAPDGTVALLTASMFGRGNKLLPAGTQTLVGVQDPSPEATRRRRQVTESVCADTVAENLAAVTREIRRAGHGGGILALPAGFTDFPSVLYLSGGQWTRPGREDPLRGKKWTSGLRDFVAWEVQRQLALDGLVIAEEVAQSGLQAKAWAEQLAPLLLERAWRHWLEDAQMTAALAGMDGAILLGGDLQPVVFGATLRLDAIDGIKFEDESAGAWVESKGHRHKSMACAAWSATGSVGFVVSEDGPTTAFRRDGGALRVLHLDQDSSFITGIL
jgi:hypothetical protein